MKYLLDNWTPIITPIAIILFALLVFSIVKLRNNRALAEKLCYIILGMEFIYKFFHYVIYCVTLKHGWAAQIPSEISQFAFFLCPLAFFTRNKWIRDGGAFLGILAGFIQLLAIAVAPDRFVRTGLSVLEFTESTAVHYAVLWGGLAQVCCIEPLRVKNVWRNYLVVLFVVLWGVLASYTWMFGSDYGHPNEPANIGFTQRCDMLPDAILERYPWLLEHHLFIIPYVIIFIFFTAIVYLISYLSMRNVKPQEPSMYGLGFRGFKEFMMSNSVAKSEDN